MAEDDTRDYAEFSARLAERAEQLPKRLRQVAQFAREHPDEIALGTAASVAENAGVQASTLVRFAKTLGYAGWTIDADRHPSLANWYARVCDRPAWQLAAEQEAAVFASLGG